MFNDKYGLTEAVLSGRKTQTRRIAHSVTDNLFGDTSIMDYAKYKVGEVVAVAQSYKDAGVEFIPEEDEEFGCHNFPAEQTPGWTNKTFARAGLMPHQIRITKVRVESLQDILEQDIFAEGIEKTKNGYCAIACMPNSPTFFNPRFAYAWLIDKISGKGTWDSNPYVFAYEFELIK